MELGFEPRLQDPGRARLIPVVAHFLAHHSLWMQMRACFYKRVFKGEKHCFFVCLFCFFPRNLLFEKGIILEITLAQNPMTVL